MGATLAISSYRRTDDVQLRRRGKLLIVSGPCPKPPRRLFPNTTKPGYDSAFAFSGQGPRV
jgi:hypothetical protein